MCGLPSSCISCSKLGRGLLSAQPPNRDQAMEAARPGRPLGLLELPQSLGPTRGAAWSPHPSAQQVSFPQPAGCEGAEGVRGAQRGGPARLPLWARRAQPPSPLRGRGWLSPAAAAEAPRQRAACLPSSPPRRSRPALLPHAPPPAAPTRRLSLQLPPLRAPGSPGCARSSPRLAPARSLAASEPPCPARPAARRPRVGARSSSALQRLGPRTML